MKVITWGYRSYNELSKDLINKGYANRNEFGDILKYTKPVSIIIDTNDRYVSSVGCRRLPLGVIKKSYDLLYGENIYMREQFEKIKKLFLKDIFSNSLVINNSDLNNLLGIQFKYGINCLNLHISQIYSEIFVHLPFDIIIFQFILINMAQELKINVGKIYLTINNVFLSLSNIKDFNKCINENSSGMKLNIFNHLNFSDSAKMKNDRLPNYFFSKTKVLPDKWDI